jgi:hypothetical protein
MQFQCEHCGQQNEVELDQSILDVRDVTNWKEALKPETAAALERHCFRLVQGVRAPTQNGYLIPEGSTVLSASPDEEFLEPGQAFRTLFLSAVARRSLTELVARAQKPSLAADIQKVFAVDVAPALEIVAANFKVLGNLSLPSAIKLARTDLSQPIAVFCFVTVEDSPDLQEKLDKLGLSYLTAEGSVGTLPTHEKNILGV